MLSRRQLWLYPLFQIPLIMMLGCLVVAALSLVLGLGRPQVAVAIAIDFSSSTSGTVRNQEIQAVGSYLEANKALKNQNQIRVFGFASQVQALTNSFTANSQQVEGELNQSLQAPNLEQQLGGGTNLNLAIQEGTAALSGIEEKRCRELLLVTDGIADVNQNAIEEAIAQKVKINAVVLGGRDSGDLRRATGRTNGIYLSDEASNLEALFVDTFFTRFNSNRRWLIFWLGAAFIFFMWMLTLPLDRWLFQGLIGLDITLAGQLALGNALFWTVLTAIVVWRLFGLPFAGTC